MKAGKAESKGLPLNISIVFVSSISQSVFLYNSHKLFITSNLFLKMFSGALFVAVEGNPEWKGRDIDLKDLKYK